MKGRSSFLQFYGQLGILNFSRGRERRIKYQVHRKTVKRNQNEREEFIFTVLRPTLDSFDSLFLNGRINWRVIEYRIYRCDWKMTFFDNIGQVQMKWGLAKFDVLYGSGRFIYF